MKSCELNLTRLDPGYLYLLFNVIGQSLRRFSRLDAKTVVMNFTNKLHWTLCMCGIVCVCVCLIQIHNIIVTKIGWPSRPRTVQRWSSIVRNNRTTSGRDTVGQFAVCSLQTTCYWEIIVMIMTLFRTVDGSGSAIWLLLTRHPFSLAVAYLRIHHVCVWGRGKWRVSA